MPGLNLWAFLIPPVYTVAVFLAALFASCFRGALAPVCLRAVCFVRAILRVFADFINARDFRRAFKEQQSQNCTLNMHTSIVDILN